MNPEPKIEMFPGKKLIGKCLTMTINENRTGELWRSFMQHRKEIQNIAGSELYSIKCYDESYFLNFDPSKSFEKWAAAEVLNFDHIPEAMETIIIPAGLYAVFSYQGASGAGDWIYRHIYAEWIPASEYMLDNRPHFDVLGEKYKNDHPDSEEDIWIPVKDR